MKFVRKSFTVSAAVIVLLAFTAGCSSTPDGPPSTSGSAELDFSEGSTMAELAAAGSVRVGIKFDQPGFGQKDLNGAIQGFDAEMAKIITGGLGLSEEDIEWVETASVNREPFLQQNKVDWVDATYAITPERQEVVSYAGPYIKMGQTLLVKKGNPANIQGPQDLAGQEVCVLNASTGQKAAKAAAPDANFVAFDVVSKCIQALQNDQVVAVATDESILIGFVAKSPEDFELAGELYASEPLGIGISKGDTEFCEFINEQLSKAAEDGRYQKAWEATLGKVGIAVQQLPEPAPCK